MILPLVIACVTKTESLSPSLDSRLDAVIRHFFSHQQEKLQIQKLWTDKAGLAIISLKNPAHMPVSFQTPRRLIGTAYFPLGAALDSWSREDLQSGRYLLDIVERTCTPEALRHLAPPQAWFDLNCESHTMTLFNDYRGFGRIFEYEDESCIIWTNKLAAAPLFAVRPAILQEKAMAEIATIGMAIGQTAAYQHMRLLPPGSLIKANTRDGHIERQRLSNDVCGLQMRDGFSEADVERAATDMQLWFKDLNQFSWTPIEMSLSGGRDSRVTAAYALSAGMSNLTWSVFYPPHGDLKIATRLLSRADKTISLQPRSLFKDTQDAFLHVHSMLDEACAILRLMNYDISLWRYLIETRESHCNYDKLYLSGAQGECAHSCNYSAIDIEQRSENAARKRLLDFIDYKYKIFGCTEFSRNSFLNSIDEQILSVAARHGISHFHVLDFLCLQTDMNRQWQGANGMYDWKTPLTVWPYVFYGFGQTAEQKIYSSFIRAVTAVAMPQWSTISYYHELPAKEKDDFYQVYPTYWEMGRGEELQETLIADNGLVTYFDISATKKVFNRLQKDYRQVSHREHYLSHRCAQKMLWSLALIEETRTLNAAIADLSGNEAASFSSSYTAETSRNILSFSPVAGDGPSQLSVSVQPMPGLPACCKLQEHGWRPYAMQPTDTLIFNFPAGIVEQIFTKQNIIPLPEAYQGNDVLAALSLMSKKRLLLIRDKAGSHHVLRYDRKWRLLNDLVIRCSLPYGSQSFAQSATGTICLAAHIPAAEGEEAGILYSADEGLSWQQGKISLPSPLTFIIACTPDPWRDKCWYATALTQEKSVILWSSDDGRTWEQVTSPSCKASFMKDSFSLQPSPLLSKKENILFLVKDGTSVSLASLSLDGTWQLHIQPTALPIARQYALLPMKGDTLLAFALSTQGDSLQLFAVQDQGKSSFMGQVPLTPDAEGTMSLRVSPQVIAGKIVTCTLGAAASFTSSHPHVLLWAIKEVTPSLEAPSCSYCETLSPQAISSPSISGWNKEEYYCPRCGADTLSRTLPSLIPYLNSKHMGKCLAVDVSPYEYAWLESQHPVSLDHLSHDSIIASRDDAPQQDYDTILICHSMEKCLTPHIFMDKIASMIKKEGCILLHLPLDNLNLLRKGSGGQWRESIIETTKGLIPVFYPGWFIEIAEMLGLEARLVPVWDHFSLRHEFWVVARIRQLN